MRQSSTQPVFNNMPTIVLWLGGVITSVTVLQLLGPPYVEDWLLRSFAIVTGMQPFERPFGQLTPFIAHTLLHGGFLHLGLNMAALLSFGPPVSEAIGQTFAGKARFFFLFIFASAAGALAQLGFTSEPGVMIGASSGLSGILAAAGYARGGLNGMARLALPWLIINLCLGVGGLFLDLPIAWLAHLGGLFVGALLAPIFISQRP